MESLKELELSELESTNGGILPALIVGAGYLIGACCAAAAGDIILNFNSYSRAIDEKLANCK